MSTTGENIYLTPINKDRCGMGGLKISFNLTSRIICSQCHNLTRVVEINNSLRTLL